MELTPYTRLALNAMTIVNTLAVACHAYEGLQERIFAAMYAILRGEAYTTTEFPVEVIEMITQFQELDHRNREFVAAFFGDIYQGPGQHFVSNSPFFTVMDTLRCDEWRNTYTREDLRRLFEIVKARDAAIPRDLPPVLMSVIEIMDMLGEELVRELEDEFFGHDSCPCCANQGPIENDDEAPLSEADEVNK